MTDLTNLSSEELKQIAQQAAQLIDKRREQEVKDAYLQAVQLARQVGVTLEELVDKGPKLIKTKKSTAGTSVAPKYRNPENSADVWSGRGKQPKWMTEQIKNNGKKLEDFLIENND